MLPTAEDMTRVILKKRYKIALLLDMDAFSPVHVKNRG